MSKSRFVSALDRNYGENGAVELDSTSNDNVDLFFKLVRNLPENSLNSLMNKVLKSGSREDIIDLFVLAFQTRHCRGGKGEKKLFYDMILILYNAYPALVCKLIEHIPFYGYYKDYLLLCELIVDDSKYDYLFNTIISAYAEQLKTDPFSVKFAPRYNKHFAKNNNTRIFRALVDKLFPKTHNSFEKYRKMISEGNKKINTTEILMCDKRYSEIDFSHVSSVCLNKFRKAFLNESVKKPLSYHEQGTGNRYPDDEDRVLCRQHLLEKTMSNNIHGKQVMPHILVEQIINKRLSESEETLFNSQWEKIKEDVLNQINSTDNKKMDLGKLVPLSDVSDSMSGIPMYVSIALGLLISEINHEAFRDRVLTFNTIPKWHNLSKCKTFCEKVNSLKKSPWGGSTDFMKAIENILEIAITNKLSNDEIPDLIVFSDMQFNEADSKFLTHYEIIKGKFNNAGYTNIPKIIFWNLRGDTTGFPVDSKCENVQLLSGFSPSLFKLILSGEQGETCTPEQLFKNAVNDEAYNKIREIVEKHIVNLEYYKI
jgi:hypothetical protein